MATKTKPPIGVSLRRGHPLAQGLAGAWLLNEGRGAKAGDVSGCGRTGTLTSMVTPTSWVPGSHGAALELDGNDDRLIVGPDAGISLGTANACVIRFKLLSFGELGDVLVGHKLDAGLYFFELDPSDERVWYNAGGSMAGVNHHIAVGDEVWLGVSRQAHSVLFYKDGVPLGEPKTLGMNYPLAISTIGGYRDFDLYYDYLTHMRCDYVYCWSRSLSAAEMAWLYREPFSFVTRRMDLPLFCVTGGTVHEAQGAAASVSSANGTAARIFGVQGAALTGSLLTGDACLGGGLQGTSSSAASLSATAACIPYSELPTLRPWSDVTIDVEPSWWREVILNGMTDTAFRLGTVPTQGWFWMRRSGCAAVYDRGSPNLASRNPDAGSGSPVCVAEADAERISLPTYLAHDANSASCYLLRRFNGCGHEEHTTGAQICVRIGPNGQMAAPAPNRVLDGNFEIRNPEFEGGGVILRWLYWPLDQQTAPQVFRIYADGGTGDIDFGNPLASVPYEGRKLYRYQSPPLESGGYRFAVTAQSAAGAEGPPLTFEVRISNVELSQPPDILDAQAI